MDIPAFEPDTTSSDADPVLVDTSGAVATITLNRPEISNALDDDMRHELLAVFERIKHEPEIRAVIITGRGAAFCAGGDLRTLEPDGPPPTAYERRATVRDLQEVIRAVRACERPIIAAVNGPAVGGGCDLALACDLRIASDRAAFGEVFSRIGLFPGTGGTYLLPRLVGVAKALELIWTGDVIDAAQASDIGLITTVVDHDELLTAASELATRLAAGPPLAIALAKSVVYRSLDLGFDDALDLAATAESITLTSDDHAEGVRAFRERRRPAYQGR